MEDLWCSLERRTERFGICLIRSGSFGSKRVSFSANDSMNFDCYDSTPTKKLCVKNQDPIFTSEQDKSSLESLPQDILIRVLCRVEHDDLKNLIFVSKSISEATLIAKKLHFAYSTPRKAVGFRDDIIADDLNEYVKFGGLAPKGSRIRKFKLSQKKLADISVTLFD